MCCFDALGTSIKTRGGGGAQNTQNAPNARRRVRVHHHHHHHSHVATTPAVSPPVATHAQRQHQPGAPSVAVRTQHCTSAERATHSDSILQPGTYQPSRGTQTHYTALQRHPTWTCPPAAAPNTQCTRTAAHAPLPQQHPARPVAAARQHTLRARRCAFSPPHHAQTPTSDLYITTSFSLLSLTRWQRSLASSPHH